MPPEDGDIFAKSQQNDQQVFDQLFFKYKTSIYRFVYYLTQNRSEADDLFQETWLRAVKNRKQIKNINDFKAWMFTIANNLYRDELRKKKIRRLFFSRKKMETDDSENFFTSPNGETCPKQHFEDLDFGMALQQAVSKLSLKQRRVFVLQEIEGFKQKEISAILHIPVGTVKSLFHRAIKCLQRELIEFQTN